MVNRRIIVATVILSLCIPLLSTRASANIINDGGPGGRYDGTDSLGTVSVDVPHPFGQSFTAESTNYHWLGLAVRDAETSAVNPPLLQYNMALYDGSGYSGSVLQNSQTVTTSDFGTHYVYFDFSNVLLTVGHTYTTSLSLLTSHENGTIGVLISSLNNISDGAPYFTDQHGITKAFPNDGDFLFRAITTAEIPLDRVNTIPEPHSFILLAAGLLGLATWRWRCAGAAKK